MGEQSESKEEINNNAHKFFEGRNRVISTFKKGIFPLPKKREGWSEESEIEEFEPEESEPKGYDGVEESK